MTVKKSQRWCRRDERDEKEKARQRGLAGTFGGLVLELWMLCAPMYFNCRTTHQPGGLIHGLKNAAIETATAVREMIRLEYSTKVLCLKSDSFVIPPRLMR